MKNQFQFSDVATLAVHNSEKVAQSIHLISGHWR